MITLSTSSRSLGAIRVQLKLYIESLWSILAVEFQNASMAMPSNYKIHLKCLHKKNKCSIKPIQVTNLSFGDLTEADDLAIE
mmetsp:Transcript_21466/g.39279  ORF Transcript_21466/g.39279 Transcript_21466/m.39279 type:complete len:82 (-) Transcript_21466:460-705(-)